MTVLVVAEKPSVARDIASALGVRSRGEGHFHGQGYIVTWAIGHLVALAEPHQMNEAWKRWRLTDLPLLPKAWPLVVSPSTRDQFSIVKRFLVDEAVRGVVCATDAGREGELIFRYIYEASKSKKPVQRLWISSLTSDAITKGFRSLRPGKDLDRLADAARARSRADWLVGMNLSRLYSVTKDDNLSVGRVQTPTLAMLVAREIEIRDFVPEDYLEVVATFAPDKTRVAAPPPARSSSKDGREEGSYDGTWIREGAKEPERRRLPFDGEEAKTIVARVAAGEATIASVDRQTRRMPPPLLYDLTELQRHANRLYGFTADRTLKLAQSLYEQRKLLSYPRTDSKHLSQTVAQTLPEIVDAIAAPYRALLAEGTGTRSLGPRFVDDTRVSDHHAIIPTPARAPADLPPDERKIYDLVCRRLLAAWHGDHVYAVTTVLTDVRSSGVDGAVVDRFHSTGTSVEEEGWKVLDVRFASRPPPRSNAKDGAQEGAKTVGAKGAPNGAAAYEEPSLPGGLVAGQRRRVANVEPIAKRTKPPPRYTDATILTAMETAGRALDEKELSRAMRDRGLGTPATRAAILETLLRREYIVREGKMLTATPKGIALVEAVHPHVKSPAMTGEWEAKLAQIERGEENLETFMGAIETYVREVVGAVSSLPPSPSGGARPSGTWAPRGDRGEPVVVAARTPRRAGMGERSELDEVAPRAPARASTRSSTRGRASAVEESVATPLPSRPAKQARTGDIDALLGSVFGHGAFRPFQRDVCAASSAGKDVLLVMPTGAGKSLCYQLPGLARGGTTLVVSPLIALMEDQVAQLTARGLAADRIHSGRSRLDARAACRAYLDGALDFLFIAPERLRVPGFPEMLARRKPTLIAIDEAHCISQWGHDFRPDYRMLGERLPLLAPTPIIALTATATPTVQEDILAALRLRAPERFIHGFRRTNIAIEVVEQNPSTRPETVARLLADPARRPAIVYAPTRSDAETIAKLLSKKTHAAAYHAGLATTVRDRVQSAFLAGKLDVVVATIAFGMGIDKPNVRTVIHTALPGSVEGYYQEIGRAGRDGLPSRAVLLHSFVDMKTHEFFFERDYPPVDVLAKLHAKIGKQGSTVEAVLAIRGLDEETANKALEKLRVAGGAVIGDDGSVRQGAGDWRDAYEHQRAFKREQLDKARRFAESSICRMNALVTHFGDRPAAGTTCGSCDVCAADGCLVTSFGEASREDRDVAERIVAALRERDGRTGLQLHRDVFAEAVDRKTIDRVLAGLARASIVRIAEDSFEKDGKRITFVRVHLAIDDDDEPDYEKLVIAAAPDPAARARAPGKKWRGFAKRKKRAAGSRSKAPRSKRPRKSD